MLGQRSLIVQTAFLGVFAPLQENDSDVLSRWNERGAPWSRCLQKQGCGSHLVVILLPMMKKVYTKSTPYLESEPHG